MQESNARRMFVGSRVPGMEDKQILVSVVEINPASVQTRVSVQREWKGSRGIIRGLKINGVLQEDHIDEVIEDGVLKKVDYRIVGSREIRQHVWSIARHMDELLKSDPEWTQVGMVGNGNLTCNPWFVASVDGRLWRQVWEGPFLVKRMYTCLVNWTARSAQRVSIEPLQFQEVDESCQVIAVNRRLDITAQVQSATYGQQIVEAGRPKSQAQLDEMVLAGQFYDLRHSFLFGRYPLGSERWLDIGLNALWTDDGQLDVGMLRMACDGAPIPVDIRGLDKEKVKRAFVDKGYLDTEYRLDGDVVHVKLRPGIYPHNMIGVRRDGTVISVVISGLSNRVGVTLAQAAEIMCVLGADDAIILDNGNDACAQVRGDFVVGAQEGRDKRLRSVLFFGSANRVVASGDFRLTAHGA